MRGCFGADFVVFSAVVVVLQGVAWADVPVEGASSVRDPALVVIEFGFAEWRGVAVKQRPFV